jgi:hypothetical protein
VEAAMVVNFTTKNGFRWHGSPYTKEEKATSTAALLLACTEVVTVLSPLRPAGQ